MKKFLGLTSFLVISVGLFVASVVPIFSLDTSTSGRVLDDFKTRHEQILFETLPLSVSGANEILETEYKINGLEALKTRLEAMEKYYSEKKQETTRERLTLEKAIKNIDSAIEITTKNIDETKIKIVEKQQKIQTLERISLETKKKIASHKKIILSYLANIYSEGNLVLDESGNMDIFKTLILTDQDTDYYLTDLTYKTLVSQLGQKFIDEYRALVREFYVNSVKTKEEKENLQNLQTRLESQKVELDSQKQEREHLLEITQGQESLYMQYVASQQQAQKQVSEAWKKATDDYQKSFDNFMKQYNCAETKQTLECIRLRQFFLNETQLAKTQYTEGTDNILVWPTKARRITTYFRDADYYRLMGSQHDAIDIATPQWSDVYAAADGYVYYIVEPTATSYSYIAIRHKNGIVTVYGHLSKIEAAPYQFVHQGEVIAKSGGAPGTAGAGPMTTGAHLHFEVWKNKEATDPLRYLSLTDVDYASLPALYQSKFINDMIEKTGSGTDVSQYKLRFVLKGVTEEERQKYLLSTYAARNFQNWELWTDVALSQKIDPSFLMCIGLSETTLGNYLKTAYNVWNVGNTDDGSTVAFSSPREGIVAMAKTFNNRYLGKYTKISQLSRWGNKTWPIYASSTSNWHDNSIRCLSALKWRFVEDDFNFRVTDN